MLLNRYKTLKDSKNHFSKKMKVSIITSSFNNEYTIGDTIKSVINQSYSNIEYIIIDGKSTDKTIKTIELFKDKIHYFLSEKDKGVYYALNKGLSVATGELIGFLHADDIYANKSIIENVVKKLEEEKTDSIYGNLLYVDKSNTKIIRNWISGKYNYNKIKTGWMPPHPTLFVKKNIYDKYDGFDTSFRIASDYDLILRFLGKHKISVSYIDEVFVRMRLGGISNKNISNIIKKTREDIKALKKNNIGGVYTIINKNISKIPQFFIPKK